MAGRRQLDPLAANRLLEPGPVALITSQHRSEHNIMTAAWMMPASQQPPLVAVAIHPSRHTHSLVTESEYLAINFPTADLLNAVHLCGLESGRDFDKFQRSGLTPIDPVEIEAPLIDECVAQIECGVIERVGFGDHDLFFCKPLAVQAFEEAFNGRWLVEYDAGQILHHLRADYYAALTRPYQASYDEEDLER